MNNLQFLIWMMKQYEEWDLFLLLMRWVIIFHFDSFQSYSAVYVWLSSGASSLLLVSPSLPTDLEKAAAAGWVQSIVILLYGGWAGPYHLIRPITYQLSLGPTLGTLWRKGGTTLVLCILTFFQHCVSLNTKTVKAKKISGNIEFLSCTLRVSVVFCPNTNEGTKVLK